MKNEGNHVQTDDPDCEPHADGKLTTCWRHTKST